MSTAPQPSSATRSAAAAGATVAALSPAERLARSREAIALTMRRSASRRDERDDLGPEWGPSPASPDQARRSAASGSSWWPVLRSFARTWWRRHPLNAMGQMAVPALSAYAQREPYKMMGYAALAGAVVAIVRPWRVMSAGALLAAALRPSEITAFAMTMLASLQASHGDDDPKGKTP
jgi:hypothetical protein